MFGTPRGGLLVDCVVLFDKKTGRVRHIHRVMTAPGATRPSRQDIEAESRGVVTRQGIDAAALAALHVAPEQLKPRATYRVDLSRLELVVMPIEAARAPAKKARRPARPKKRKRRG